MPDNDQERRSIVITFNLKILVIVIMTVAVTFLFIRSNQTMVNTPTLVKTVHNTGGTGLTANNSENRLVLTAVNFTMGTKSTKDIVTDHSLSQKHDGIMLKNDQEVFPSLPRLQILNPNLQDIKENRSRRPELIQDDYIVVKPNSYRKKLNRYTIDNKIDKIMSINVEDKNSEVTVKNGMDQMDTGSNSVNNEYSTIDVNVPLPDENDLNSHYNVNDSSYNSGSYAYKEIEDPVDEIKLVTDGQSEQINTIEDLSQLGSDSYAYRPHSYYDFTARYPTGQAQRPSASIPMKNPQKSKHVPDEEYHKPISQQPTVGSTLIGSNNALASSQSSILSTLLPNLSSNMGGSSSSGSSSFSSSSISPAGTSSSGSSSSTISSDIPPDLLSFLLSGLSRESGGRLFLDKSCDSSNILLPDSSLGGTMQSEIENPYFTPQVQDPNTFNRQQYKSFDPTLTISQKILDSEKCVQSIACRLAVAEKTGIIPIQIKLWILNGILKFIPEEKYELYFKTYNFINNEIETTNTSLTKENWSAWCLERFNSDNNTN